MRHNLFAPHASARETIGFLAGLAVVVGAFGPWYFATLVSHPPMGELTREPVTLDGGGAHWVAAVAAMLALAATVAPLRRPVRAWTRVALFGVSLAAAVFSMQGPGGFVFGWDGVFSEYENVRPAWGLLFVLGGTLLGLGIAASRLGREPDEQGMTSA